MDATWRVPWLWRGAGGAPPGGAAPGVRPAGARRGPAAARPGRPPPPGPPPPPPPPPPRRGGGRRPAAPPAGRRQGRLILAANHVSPIDPLMLMAACSRAGIAPRFMATAGLFRAPVAGSIMRACGQLRVDRRTARVAEALPAAAAALR